MYDHFLERGFVGEEIGLEHHAAHPEEDDVVSCHEDVGWEVTFVVRIIGIRPA